MIPLPPTDTGMSRDNKSLHRRLVARDGATCCFCGVSEDELSERLQVDRITAGGRYTLDNTRLLCGSCNAARGDRDQFDDRAARFADATTEQGFTVIWNAIICDPALSVEARLLYAILCRLAWNGTRVDHGQDEMAATMGRSERSIRSYIAELTEAGLLKVHARGRGMTAHYVLYNPRATRSTDRQPGAGLDRQPASAQTGSQLPVHTNRTGKEQVPQENPQSAPREPRRRDYTPLDKPEPRPRTAKQRAEATGRPSRAAAGRPAHTDAPRKTRAQLQAEDLAAARERARREGL